MMGRLLRFWAMERQRSREPQSSWNKIVGDGVMAER